METLRRPYTAEEHASLVAAQARQAGMELDARRIAQEIALRQWCIEQAVAVVGAPPMMVSHRPLAPELSDEALAKSLRHHDPYIMKEKPDADVVVAAVVVVARDILEFVQYPTMAVEVENK